MARRCPPTFLPVITTLWILSSAALVLVLVAGGQTCGRQQLKCCTVAVELVLVADALPTFVMSDLI